MIFIKLTFLYVAHLVVHSILDNFSSGSSGYDPRRQPPSDQDGKGARPPPGIDI